jgi:hypothetical protein
VTLAGIIAAARAAKGTISDMRFMVVGKFFLRQYVFYIVLVLIHCSCKV